MKAEVLFQGEPPPDIQWIREGPDGAVAQVAANRADEVTVTVTERSARLALNSVRKAQEGRYTVTATNESGAATASFELSVRDRPSPPGRVTAATATVAAGGGAGGGEMKDGALLSWKRPEQDGGCSIDYYQVSWTVGSSLLFTITKIRPSSFLFALQGGEIGLRQGWLDGLRPLQGRGERVPSAGPAAGKTLQIPGECGQPDGRVRPGGGGGDPLRNHRRRRWRGRGGEQEGQSGQGYLALVEDEETQMRERICV